MLDVIVIAAGTNSGIYLRCTLRIQMNVKNTIKVGYCCYIYELDEMLQCLKFTGLFLKVKQTMCYAS